MDDSPFFSTHTEVIQVSSYAGFRGNEKPQRFVLHGIHHEIQCILESALKQDVVTGDRFYWYKILTHRHLEFILINVPDTQKWFLISQAY